MIRGALSKYKRCFMHLSPGNLPQLPWFSYRQELPSVGRRCNSSHRKMIGMRRGLWGKPAARQNQMIPRKNSSWSTFTESAVTSTTGPSDQMPAADETVCPPSSKRAKLEADMPTSTIEVPPKLRFAKLSDDATAPKRGSDFAAGYDLHSAEECVVPAQGLKTVMTDIQVELPEGCYGRVAPRSGLARHNHIDVGAGVIDKDYRGNVGVVMFNHSMTDFKVEKGARIAQLICEKIFYPELEEMDKLTDTKRGSGGFGSTGTK